MSNLRAAAIVSLIAATSGLAAAQHVVPSAFAGGGNGSFIGPLANGARTYQLLIHADMMAGMTGQELTGLAFRNGSGATSDWPPSDVTFANYDIFLSGSVNPADRSLVFADNVVGPQTQVRSGSLTIAAGDYSSGNSPNEFGSYIGFGSGWVYEGGNLLIEIRHSGSGMTSRAVDAVTASSGPASGYGTLFSAVWQSGYASTDGLQGNFAVTQLRVVPAPAGMAVMGLGLLAAGRRRR